ncbi:hypothetical protein NMCA_09490 [Enterobacter ludwigii]|nr:hypothetical protein NMCA_09490 [Enterobacter ludwigii]
MAFAINTQKVLLCAQCPTARAFFSEREPVWIVVPIVARVVPHRPFQAPFLACRTASLMVNYSQYKNDKAKQK